MQRDSFSICETATSDFLFSLRHRPPLATTSPPETRPDGASSSPVATASASPRHRLLPQSTPPLPRELPDNFWLRPGREDCKIYPSDLSHELLCFRNLTMAAAVPTVNLLHLPAKSSELRLFVAGAYSILRLRSLGLWSPESRVVATKLPSIEAVRCLTKPTEESEPENLSSDEEEVREGENKMESQQDSLDATARPEFSNGSAVTR